MKTPLKIFPLAFALLYAATSGGQEIDPQVRVSRDYEANIINMVKPVPDYRVNDSIYRFDIKFDYALSSIRYEDMYEFTPLPFLEIPEDRKGTIPVFYSRIGFSYPTNPYGEIYFRPDLKTEKTDLLIYGKHNSFWHKINGKIADYMDNSAGILVRHAWKTGNLFFKTGYTGGYNTFYGFTGSGYDIFSDQFASRSFMKDNMSAENHGVSSIFGISSSNTEKTAVDYKVNISHRYMHVSPSISLPGHEATYPEMDENHLRVNGLLGATFASHHKIHVGYDMEMEFYGNGNTYCLLQLNPEYRYEHDRWRLNLGLGISVPFEDAAPGEKLGGSRQIFFPDIEISFQAIRKALVVYVHATGGDKMLDYAKLSDTYRWITPACSVPSISTERINGKIGITGTASDVFSYNLYGEYSKINDGVYLMGDGNISSLQNIMHQNYDRIGAGLEMAGRIKNVTLGADFKYNYYFGDTPYMQVPFSMILYGKYSWKDRIVARVDVGYRSGTQACYYTDNGIRTDARIKGFVDVGINLAYMINQNLTVFIEGNNLTNSTQQYIYGYDLPGINFGAGLFIKF